MMTAYAVVMSVVRQIISRRMVCSYFYHCQFGAPCLLALMVCFNYGSTCSMVGAGMFHIWVFIGGPGMLCADMHLRCTN